MSRDTFSIVKIMERTLDYVDPRLMYHGRRVSYLTYKMLKELGRRDEDYLRQMAVVALLHDIGAYKTEEIDKMLGFETQKVWEHSIYGYLFIKYFSPLAELAPAILLHHADYLRLADLYPQHQEAAQIIKIADRFDISVLHHRNPDLQEIRACFESKRGEEFHPGLIDLFFAGEETNPLAGMDDDEEFRELLYGRNYSENEADDFIKMLVLSIDFRSPQTVLHTFSSAYACKAVTEIMGIPREERERILKGVLLHDIGKIAISSKILNKCGRLSPEEMAVMRQHVEFTEKILTGEVDDCVLKLAVRHHEKLDGSGYPRGLNASSLAAGERIIAVTDIFSALMGARSYKDPFPAAKIVEILNEMACAKQLDADVVSVFTTHCDWIMGEVNKETALIVEMYRRLMTEYLELEQDMHFFNDQDSQNSKLVAPHAADRFGA